MAPRVTQPRRTPASQRGPKTNSVAGEQRAIPTACRNSTGRTGTLEAWRAGPGRPGAKANALPRASTLKAGRATPASQPGKGMDPCLWEHVWSLVEPSTADVDTRNSTAGSGGTTMAVDVYREAGPAEAKRRRLVGKQPCLAIVPYRRLVGKQPPPPTYSVPRARGDGAQRIVRGHYDILSLRRTASQTEVGAAYRRRARETHPDKGGDVAEFHRVVAAFEELADEGRRAAYDRSLDLFGRRDGMAAETKTSRDRCATAVLNARGDDPWLLASARVARMTLLCAEPEDWQPYLSMMQREALEALHKLLLGGTSPAPAAEKRPRDMGPVPSVKPSDGPARIASHKKGYKVVVMWAALSVSTGYTRSLEQAVDWQIALLGVRGVAQARIRRLSRRQSAEEIDPLTEEELLQLVESEPSLELVFTAVVQLQGRQGRKIFSALPVAELRLASELRRGLLAAARARRPVEALKAAQQTADAAVAHSRSQRKARERGLAAAVLQELSRSAPHARRPTKGGSGAAAKRSPKALGPFTPSVAEARRTAKKQTLLSLPSSSPSARIQTPQKHRKCPARGAAAAAAAAPAEPSPGLGLGRPRPPASGSGGKTWASVQVDVVAGGG